ncbi:MAG: hypothetical protein JSW58_03045 [Candidatus Latescibacterota bacterium]|nr:MAG: hypothetical protein JSW58_03045 [Candidatus Latescibacterota bacterium]
MKTTVNRMLLALIVGTVMLAAVWVGSSSAGVHVGVAYSSGSADVSVRLGRGYDDEGYYYDDDYYYDGDYAYDVYPSADDVVLYVRASRSCYTTVYVIDTEGYIHVIHPLSPFDDAYLIGGRVYRYRLRDFGFYDPYFGRGVAFAFAVMSPVPFSFAHYGVGIFGPQIGFRIYGDPFIASRLFYFSILPAGCRRSLVAVSYARFYVREYVRYPSYLCVGWHDYYGTRSYCRGHCAAHRQYRVHAKDPYRVIHPKREIRNELTRYAKINRTAAKDMRDIRQVTGTKHLRDPDIDRKTKRVVKSSELRTVSERTNKNKTSIAKRTARRIENSNRVNNSKAIKNTRTVAPKSPTRRSTVKSKSTSSKTGGQERVVRSTRNTFVKSKNDYTKMREKLKQNNRVNRSGSKKVSAKKAGTAKDQRVSKKSHKKVAQSNSRAGRQVKAGKRAKRAN